MSVQTQIETIKQHRESDARYKRRVCKWKYDDYLDTWDTQCGESFMLNVGTPTDNSMNYCPYCGHEIRH